MVMDVYRLSRDELEYELAVRDCTNFNKGTVVSLRRQLKELVQG